MRWGRSGSLAGAQGQGRECDLQAWAGDSWELAVRAGVGMRTGEGRGGV